MSTCTVTGCDRPHEARGYCHGHFERLRSGRPIGGPFLDTPMKRFHAKVEVADTGCWVWTGGTDGENRYGGFYDSTTKRVARAHRWRWEQEHGPVPEGLELDHLCRTTLCVNPEHLEPVDHRTNLRRGEWGAGVNYRKTHCKHGHEFTEENTGRTPAGHRFCRTCVREQGRLAQRRHRARKTRASERAA